jgi:hypothetical protein
MNGETITKQTWERPEITDLDVAEETSGKVATAGESGGFGAS